MAITYLYLSTSTNTFGFAIDPRIKDSFPASISYSGDLSLVYTSFKYSWPKSDLKLWALNSLGLNLKRSKLLKFDSIVSLKLFIKLMFVESSKDIFGNSFTLFVDCCFLKSICSKVFLHLWWSLTVNGLFSLGDKVWDFTHLLSAFEGSWTLKSSPLTSPIILWNLAWSIVGLLWIGEILASFI